MVHILVLGNEAQQALGLGVRHRFGLRIDLVCQCSRLCPDWGPHSGEGIALTESEVEGDRGLRAYQEHHPILANLPVQM